MFAPAALYLAQERGSKGAVFQRLSSAPKKGKFTRGQWTVQESYRQEGFQVSGWLEPEHRTRQMQGRTSQIQMRANVEAKLC